MGLPPESGKLKQRTNKENPCKDGKPKPKGYPSPNRPKYFLNFKKLFEVEFVTNDRSGMTY